MVQSAVSSDEGRVFENLRWISDLPMKLEMLHCKIAATDEHTIRLRRRVRGRGSACESSGKFRNGGAVLSKPAPDPNRQLPNIAPPQVMVSASHPGASAQVVADAEKTPFEQRIIGSTKVRPTLGVAYPIDVATVDVQSRVSQLQRWTFQQAIAKRKSDSTARPTVALNNAITDVGGSLAANRSGDLSWLSRDEPCCDVYLRSRELGA